ncbi:sodium:proton exchanger [Candidatus Falkowbacteria bacterium HGW-Falkowbacteria-1]|uniref:Sodium:proton exchanger n=1 Tax=Candidatus Falkowbacteria bacterium HGW-Falkowbacteria-1 TaxID=2013768 RepID=A0A2N2E986_9BACT|nr:MAG: sodium:proton exchanger [Candidatus Falkowbacteria bacterium HGW-Falkowbacteria-1]
MNLVLYLLALLASFYLLAVVCDRYFVFSLDKIALKLNMNSDMAGATLMAVGSSAPELFVSFIALFKPGNEAMGAGTIVGSAIFNILVIIGASAMVRKAFIAWQPVIRDVIFYSLSIILLIYSFWDGKIVLLESIAFLALYGVYIIAVLQWRKILPYKDDEKEPIEVLEEGEDKEQKNKSALGKFLNGINLVLDFIFPKEDKYWLVFIVSIASIAGLSWVLVESAVGISVILHVPAVIIGLTVLAAGTSIPDLISSMIVARQGRGGMAISNAIGSNIFDILIGLGLPWFIITVGGKVIPVVTENLNSSIILLFATVLAVLGFLMAKKWHINKLAGIGLISIYIGYLLWNIFQVL